MLSFGIRAEIISLGDGVGNQASKSSQPGFSFVSIAFAVPENKIIKFNDLYFNSPISPLRIQHGRAEKLLNKQHIKNHGSPQYICRNKKTGQRPVFLWASP
ncbi:hypothetical protein [Rivihabitans pingtungensis]|uniref:hypothetical protein n=1 Tax=Rivihabitans pingtungensis TaxID=1054498 RepID=UPI002FD9BF90